MLAPLREGGPPQGKGGQEGCPKWGVHGPDFAGKEVSVFFLDSTLVTGCEYSLLWSAESSWSFCLIFLHLLYSSFELTVQHTSLNISTLCLTFKRFYFENIKLTLNFNFLLKSYYLVAFYPLRSNIEVYVQNKTVNLNTGPERRLSQLL